MNDTLIEASFKRLKIKSQKNLLVDDKISGFSWIVNMKLFRDLTQLLEVLNTTIRVLLIGVFSIDFGII